MLDIATMETIVEESLGQRPFAMRLLSAFALLAIVLASVGIYSVLAYTVRQRVREIGIRMAMGAQAGDMLRLLIVEGMRPTLLGVAIGLVAAAALGRVLATLVFDVGTLDVPTLLLGSLVLAGVGCVASLLPAARALRVDPLRTLRDE